MELFIRLLPFVTTKIMKTYAIIEAGGEQVQVEPGRFYDVRHLISPSSQLSENFWGHKILLYRVLMIRHKSTTVLGTPWIKNAIVKGRILHIRYDEKVTIFKMRAKKKTRRKRGYRQQLARFIVDAIYLNGNQLLTN